MSLTGGLAGAQGPSARMKSLNLVQVIAWPAFPDMQTDGLSTRNVAGASPLPPFLRSEDVCGLRGPIPVRLAIRPDSRRRYLRTITPR